MAHSQAEEEQPCAASNVEGLHATDISTLLDQEGKLVSVEHMSAGLLLAVP